MDVITRRKSRKEHTKEKRRSQIKFARSPLGGVFFVSSFSLISLTACRQSLNSVGRL